MNTGQGLTIVEFTNPKDLPAQFQQRGYDTLIRCDKEHAAEEMHKKFPWYQEIAYWHRPTKAIFIPEWKEE